MNKTIIPIFILTALAAILIAVSLSLVPLKPPVLTAGLSAKITKPKEQTYTKILFVGDIMLDRGVKYYSEKNSGNDFVFSAKGGPASGWETLSDFLKSQDLVAANLEGPITENKSISITAKMESPESFFFTFDPSWAETLSKNNIKLVNLGNNHILNFSGEGLQSTKKYLTEAGIDYFGSPDNPKSIVKEINGIKISFISYNEFSTYRNIEADMTIKEIQEAEDTSDIVVVFCHWGVEYSAEPSNAIKEIGRQFIDNGADLVIGTHPHVIQPIEVYKGKRIYYSLGNFIFDQYFSEETKKGMGVILKINDQNKKLEFEEINFYMQSNSQTIITE